MLHDDSVSKWPLDEKAIAKKINVLLSFAGVRLIEGSPIDTPTLESCLAQDSAAPSLNAINTLRDWLLATAPRIDNPADVVEGHALALMSLGFPLDRHTTSVEVLHSEIAAKSWIWQRGEETKANQFDYVSDNRSLYYRSPFFLAQETGRWVMLDVEKLPETSFGITPDLKEAGYLHYMCVPIVFSNGNRSNLTYATKNPAGFSTAQLAILRYLLPSQAAMGEIRAVNRRLDEVLRIYVGDEPHKAILNGSIHRGQMSKIKAAILFADMRSYTRISSRQSPEETVAMLNTYFDCLVGPIEAQGGEILKYMGDGLLAIFRHHDSDYQSRAMAAGEAAQAALLRIRAANATQKFRELIDVGIALHLGEAAYGNVGSGTRLDFTVIGSDVNIASRIARLNKRLAEPLLVSEDFAKALDNAGQETQNPHGAVAGFALTDLGFHEIDGYHHAIRVYRLANQAQEIMEETGALSAAQNSPRHQHPPAVDLQDAI